jgi:hypothetical protein
MRKRAGTHVAVEQPVSETSKYTIVTQVAEVEKTGQRHVPELWKNHLGDWVVNGQCSIAYLTPWAGTPPSCRQDQRPRKE